jgi:hypothetical protein
MASHTVSELQTAARVVADAARATGLDPTLFEPALGESESEWSDEDLELSAAPADEMRSPIAAEAAPAPAVFDLERESTSIRAA